MKAWQTCPFMTATAATKRPDLQTVVIVNVDNPGDDDNGDKPDKWRRFPDSHFQHLSGDAYIIRSKLDNGCSDTRAAAAAAN